MKARIALDVRAISSQAGGIGRYVSSLVDHLPPSRSTKYYLVSNKSIPLKYRDNQASPSQVLQRISAPFPLYEHALVPIFLKKEHVDLFHSPTPTIPFPKICKYVMTIHEISYEIYPDLYPTKEQMYWRSGFGRLLAKKADWLIVPSERTKQDIVRIYRVPETRISVIYHGVDKTIFYPASDEDELESVRHRYGISGKFILYVGLFWRKRNLPLLLEAFTKFKMINKDYKLVLVGGDVRVFLPFAKAEQLWRMGDIISLRYVSDHDLRLLYCAAEVFVYPSSYEGFGFTPLEAMACGTPVVTSKASSLPEVVGPAGVMVVHKDPDELSNAILRVVDDHEMRTKMIRAGLERAKLFTWESTATKTFDVYNTVLNL